MRKKRGGERQRVGEMSRRSRRSMKENAAAAFLQTTVYIRANKSLCFQCPKGCMKVVVTTYCDALHRGYNEDTDVVAQVVIEVERKLTCC